MKLIALAALCACIPDNGPLMRPGEDCMACHGGTGNLLPGVQRRHAKAWTAAGTVFSSADPAVGVEGAYVEITDATGFAFSPRTNLAGNFYTRETLQFPLQRACIAFEGVTHCQQSPVAGGSCNSCHGLAFLGATQPPLMAP